MNDKIKIKIAIADRVYPLTIDAQREEGLRSASKKIDEKIKQYEASFAVRDKQDVLSMCVLDFASQAEQTKIETSVAEVEAINRLQALEKKIDSIL